MIESCARGAPRAPRIINSKGIFMAESRLKSLVGNENADDYVRTYAPKGRWSDAWNLFKSNIVKFVIINVLTLVFFLPAVLIVYLRLVYVTNLGTVFPFSANAGISIYTPSTVGLAERIVFSADIIFYGLLVVSSLIAAVGISGGAYSVKKMINTHGEFSIKGYFHGVKTCYFNTIIPVVVFMLLFFASVIVSDWADMEIAYGASAAGPITAKVCIIIATVLVGIYGMWLFAVGVSYKVKAKYLFKNSFVLLIGTILQTIFMLAFALIPVWIMVIGMYNTFFLVVGILVFIFIGFSFIFLSWMSYTQWVFDSFIEPAIVTEKEAKRAAMTPKQLEQEKLDEARSEARELLAAGKSELISKPIKPIDISAAAAEIPATFTRADVAAARDARTALEGEISEYYEQHKNDARYVEYNKLFAEREKALNPTDKKGKKKKISADNLLK